MQPFCSIWVGRKVYYAEYILYSKRSPWRKVYYIVNLPGGLIYYGGRFTLWNRSSLSPLCSITLLQPPKKQPKNTVIMVIASSKHLLWQFRNWATHSLVYSLLTYTTYVLLTLISCIRCTMDHCLVLYVVFWLRTGKKKNGQLKYIMNSLKIRKK
jgi:hypothetical protein